MLLYIVYFFITFTHGFDLKYQLMRYNHNQFIDCLNPLVTYTYFKIKESDAYDQSIMTWKSCNRNIHYGIKYAKRREDKSIYFGVKNENQLKYSDIDEYVDLKHDIPDILFTLDVESNDSLKLHNIIVNPSKEINIYTFKSVLKDFRLSGISIDLNDLRDYDSGRWYLELVKN